MVEMAVGAVEVVGVACGGLKRLGHVMVMVVIYYY
jgi:hypothetical protein